MKKIAFLFPGQGAQSVGMGQDFYDNFTVAREYFQWGDELLERSLSTLIFNGPSDRLTETRNSQTAIYLTSMAILHVIYTQFPELKPAVCAGLSLGEYTALTASKRIAFDKCLSLVQFRGEVMNAACESTKGAMAAIFGLSAEEIECMVKEIELPRDLWVANFNCPGQTVISGTAKGVEAGIIEAKKRGAKRTIPLKVHGAFHSGLMQSAEDKLREKIEDIPLQNSEIDLVMNVVGNYVSDDAQIKENIIRQVTSSVRWEQGIRAMSPQVDLFIEIGCGSTLTGMNKHIGKQLPNMAPTITISQYNHLDQLAEVL